MMEIIGTYLAAMCLLIGAGFTLVGAIGLTKLPDPMTRLHAPTKVGTMGIGALLLASMIIGFVSGDGSFHELLVMGFLFITAPISAKFMSNVNIHLKSCDPLPDAPGDQTWATLSEDGDEDQTGDAIKTL